MRLVAVVLSWNRRDDTLACLESLRGIETVCVDNGSTDGSAEAVAESFPEVELIRHGENLGYAAGNNAGIRLALERGADWVWLVNNDAVVDAGAAAALEEAARVRPDAGVLACKVYFAEPPDLLWYAGGRFNLLLGYSGRQDGYGQRDDGRFDALRDVERATGAAMAISRAAIERAGLLDEDLFAYVEDVEWCLRIRRAGFAVVFVPGARVWHRVSASTGGAASPVLSAARASPRSPQASGSQTSAGTVSRARPLARRSPRAPSSGPPPSPARPPTPRAPGPAEPRR